MRGITLLQKANDVYKSQGVRGVLRGVNSYYSGISKPSVVKVKPLFITVRTTMRCNLRCKYCEVTLLQNRPPDLDLERFMKICDNFPTVISINLTGGEPLLNRYIFDMVRYAGTKGIKTGFFTNATLMNSEVAEEIVSSGLQRLAISVDGATAKTYESIRIGASFNKIMQNIESLLKVKKDRKASNPRVTIASVLMKSNINELPALIEMAKKIGVDKILLAPVRLRESVGGMEHQGFRPGDHEFKSSIKEIFEKAKKIGVNVEVNEVGICLMKKRAVAEICQWPWQTCVITLDGYIVPCCYQLGPEELNFGNIYERNFDDIWNSAQYRAFRTALKSGNLPKICRYCA